MKKLIILQNEGMALGGIWFVNKAISEELVKLGYEVDILSIRNAAIPTKLCIDKRVKLVTINEKDLWGVTRRRDIYNLIKKFHFVKGIKLYFKRLEEMKVLNSDYDEVRKYIRRNNPDYILTTHYQLLDAVPKDFLYKTIHEQHTSFYATKMIRDNIRVFNKYKDKVKFVWLTKSTCDDAVNNGYVNSTYIYNPVRFRGDKKALVSANKKLITITRLSEEKRIDLMIDIVKDIFKDSKFSDWTFEIYGKGELEQDVIKWIGDNKQIYFKGLTDDAEKELLRASIHLNTSLFEGFSLSVIEAAYCGVPTVTFNFGESIDEEIIQGETGLYVEQGNVAGYKNKLRELMDNSNKLEKMSDDCRLFATSFGAEVVVKKWIEVFDSLY